MSDFKPTVTVIADSISAETGTRLTTLEIKLHRYLLPYLSAHRTFSRTYPGNHEVQASRHTNTLLATPVYPTRWTARRTGVQSSGPLPTARVTEARHVWDSARQAALSAAWALEDIGVHRSIAQRVLEPFMAVTVVCSATDFDDFITQTLDHVNHREPFADSEIMDVAQSMSAAIDSSAPEKLAPGQWHLPYLDAWELQNTHLTAAIHTATARCADLAYQKLGIINDREVFRRLWHAVPVNLTPLEHLATPAKTTETVEGNFPGWHQLLHLDLSAFV